MEHATPSPGNEFRQPSDASFTAAIPERYEKDLVPLLFEPYARDLCDRVARYAPSRVLEIAAGTGALTRELGAALPESNIVATDLNQAMLDVAARSVHAANVRLERADAASLPFEAHTFDVVVAQFGVMFFPDKGSAFREARRMLRDDGTFIFSVWDGAAKNPFDDAICETYKRHTGEACFLERVPFGYSDRDRVTNDLRRAGFTNIWIERVKRTTTVRSPVHAFDALVNGSPLAADFDSLGMERGSAVRAAIAERLTSLFGDGEFNNDMCALVIAAS